MSSFSSKLDFRHHPAGNYRYQRRLSTRPHSDHNKVYSDHKTEFSDYSKDQPVPRTYGPFNSKIGLIVALVSAVAIIGVILGIVFFILGGDSEDTDRPVGSSIPLNDSYWARQKQKCGLPQITPELISSRIVGSTEAKPHSWPWQISLVNYRYNGGYHQFRHICGGTLIGPNYVITAVHCFFNHKRTSVTTNPNNYRVIVGAHDKAQITRGAAFTKILAIYHHPLNNLATFAATRKPPVNDITILKLQHAFDPAQKHPIVAYACLPPTNSFPPVGKRCWSSGWGKTLGSGYEKVLKQVPQPIISETTCNKFYANLISYNQHVCVQEQNMGTCQGDSGGPLVCNDRNSRWVLYGATSFGPKTCITAPGVFVTVSRYLDWICCTLRDKDTPPCQNIYC